jgi:hypothetical protein
LAIAIATPADAIIIRHDRDAARYLELGSRYPQVCKVGRRMGDGTLVGSRHILTAAHVARGLGRSGNPVATCAGVDYGVTATYIHPDWTDMGPHDVAVLELERAVEGITPLPLYGGADETGRVAIMVGHGATGTGDSSARSEDGARRGATNVIEEADDLRMRFHFDAPPGGTDLEGIPGPGDSGGPAIITVEGVDHVAGVSSLGQPGANGPGTYGANDFFVRVSTHLDWIQTAIAGDADLLAPAATTIPEGILGERFAALVALVEAGPDADVEAFVRDHMAPSPNVARRIEALRELVNDFAGAQGGRIVDQTDGRLVAVFTTSGGEELLGVEIENAPPHRVRGVIRGRM